MSKLLMKKKLGFETHPMSSMSMMVLPIYSMEDKKHLCHSMFNVAKIEKKCFILVFQSTHNPCN